VLRQDFPYFVQYDVSPEEAAREAGAGLVGDWLEAMLHKEPGLQDDVHTWTSAIESTFSPGAAAQPGPGCHVAWGGEGWDLHCRVQRSRAAVAHSVPLETLHSTCAPHTPRLSSFLPS
jgi:hypothetical protein